MFAPDIAFRGLKSMLNFAAVCIPVTLMSKDHYGGTNIAFYLGNLSASTWYQHAWCCTLLRNRYMIGPIRHGAVRRSCYLIFLFCYFTYVIFPVSYTFRSGFQHATTKTIGHRLHAAHKGLPSLLSGLLREANSANSIDEPTSPSATHILLIKKRGLNPSLKQVLQRPACECARVIDDLAADQPRIFADAVPLDLFRETEGFRLTFSGIAPPRS